MNNNKIIKLSLFSLILVVFLTSCEQTKKINWQDEHRNNYFTSKFDYFDGTHLIPIECKKGEYVRINYSFNFVKTPKEYDNGKPEAIGYSLLKPNRLTKGEDPSGKTLITDEGTHYIKTKVDNASGSFKINWICEK